MKIANIKKKSWIILLSILAAAVLLGGTAFALNSNEILSQEDWYRQLGAAEAKGLLSDSDSNQVYMQGDTITLYTKDVRQRAERYALFQKENPEEEAVRSLLSDLAFEKAALEAGYTVTDEELDQYLREMREGIEQAENYADYLTYIEGTGMNEDDYWASLAPSYKQQMLIGKYLNPLHEQFYQDHADEENLSQKWEQEKQKMAEKILKKDHVKKVR
ncbi:MAG: hypothetical protein ACOX60_12630 [Massiliimalia sp.]|jgi:hypothetical protein